MIRVVKLDTCLRARCKCGALLEYDSTDVRETYRDTGPYEVECPRTVVTCPECGGLVDVDSRRDR